MPLARELRKKLNEQWVVLPVFNPVALELLQLLDDPDTTYFSVISTIKKDQALASQVLKLSNSPAYAGRVPCETIEKSAIRLGTHQIANLAIASSHSSLHTSSTPLVHEVMQELWLHSHACAIGCRALAHKSGHQPLADVAYLAGLLHDIGKLYLLKAMEKISGVNPSRQEFDREKLRDIFTEMHVEAGLRVMEQLNIPLVYKTIVQEHHAETFDKENILLAIVRLVNFNSRHFSLNNYPTQSDSLTPDTELGSFIFDDQERDRLESVMTGSREIEERRDTENVLLNT